MKMLIVVLADEDTEPVLRALLEAEYRVTRLASSGGFFRRGNTTLLIGTQDERVELGLETIRKALDVTKAVDQSRATVFVLNVADFKQL